MADNKNLENNDIEYTIVMNGNYSDIHEQDNAKEEPAKTEAAGHTDIRDTMDRLYYEYERRWLKDPTVLDKDDVYPHSYHWRLGGKYDFGKIEVLVAAIKERKKIADTEAYQEYVEAVKNSKFSPDSWD